MAHMIATSDAQANEMIEQLANGLPIAWGTGYRIEQPCCIVVRRHFDISVTVCPQGENYYGGSRPEYRHSIQVQYA